MAAATVSRVGSDLVFTEPRGFIIDAALEAGVLHPGNTLVGLDSADGIWKAATATGIYNLVGVLRDEYDTTDDDADGDTVGKVHVQRVIKLISTGLDGADVGKSVYLTDNQTVTLTPGEGSEEAVTIAGGAAGAHTATGVAVGDRLISVLGYLPGDDGANQEFEDLTSEFSITDDDEISNVGGTDTTGYELVVRFANGAPGYVGYIVEVESATLAYVFVPGQAPSRV